MIMILTSWKDSSCKEDRFTENKNRARRVKGKEYQKA